MFKRLADWCVPASALTDIGRVRWRIEGDTEPTASVKQIACTMQVPLQLLGSWDTWYGKRNTWKRWPKTATLEEIIFADLHRWYDHYVSTLAIPPADIFSPDQGSGVPSAGELSPLDADHPEGR